jgi:hypothetical protein
MNIKKAKQNNITRLLIDIQKLVKINNIRNKNIMNKYFQIMIKNE